LLYRKKWQKVKGNLPLREGMTARNRLQGNKMGWTTGFEPATTGTTIQDSNQLSYVHRHFNLGCSVPIV
jgi:hypothetical protein